MFLLSGGALCQALEMDPELKPGFADPGVVLTSTGLSVFVFCYLKHRGHFETCTTSNIFKETFISERQRGLGYFCNVGPEETK